MSTVNAPVKGLEQLYGPLTTTLNNILHIFFLSGFNAIYKKVNLFK